METRGPVQQVLLRTFALCEAMVRNIPLKVGLTGPIGSGKTTVARVFEVLGVPVYYADDRARMLMVEAPPVREAVRKIVGEKAYGASGQLRRDVVAKAIFEDPARRKKLEALVHRAVFEDFLQWLEGQHTPYVVMEAALICESAAKERIPLDAVVYVDAPVALRHKRLWEARGYSSEEIRRRERAQWPERKKAACADFIIHNDEKKSIIVQVWHLHQTFGQKSDS